jgi:hypothetical protein
MRACQSSRRKRGEISVAAAVKIADEPEEFQREILNKDAWGDYCKQRRAENKAAQEAAAANEGVKTEPNARRANAARSSMPIWRRCKFQSLSSALKPWRKELMRRIRRIELQRIAELERKIPHPVAPIDRAAE